jgi:hypothetical protein
MLTFFHMVVKRGFPHQARNKAPLLNSILM